MPPLNAALRRRRHRSSPDRNAARRRTRLSRDRWEFAVVAALPSYTGQIRGWENVFVTAKASDWVERQGRPDRRRMGRGSSVLRTGAGMLGFGRGVGWALLGLLVA